MTRSNKAAAPEGTAASHKEDNIKLSTSQASVPDWRQAVVSWFSGGRRPSPTLMRLAANAGLTNHPPKTAEERVRVLTLTGFDTEEIVAAVPELNPIHVVETVDRVPGEARSILDLHLQGFTPIEISNKIDVSRPKVYYWLDKLDQTPHKRSRNELTARQRDQIVKAWRSGEPVADIARRFKASYDQVRYAVQVAS